MGQLAPGLLLQHPFGVFHTAQSDPWIKVKICMEARRKGMALGGLRRKADHSQNPPVAASHHRNEGAKSANGR